MLEKVGSGFVGFANMDTRLRSKSISHCISCSHEICVERKTWNEEIVRELIAAEARDESDASGERDVRKQNDASEDIVEKCLSEGE